MIADKIVHVSNLNKSYKAVQVLSDISFEVKEGEIFGFIGPDGAGKTSLFRIINTLLLPDSGRVSVFGLDTKKDYKSIRQRIGYMPGRFSLYPDLSVEENLSFFASIFGSTIAKNYHLIKDIYSHIEPFKKRKAGALSGGMKQKLALSCALIHKPDLLVLDEPTTGVDAVSRTEFWEMLKNLKNQGITIIVSTPYMDEASLCERIALISQGKILDINTPEAIIAKSESKLFSITAEDKYSLLKLLRNYSDCKTAFLFGENVHFSCRSENADKDKISEYLRLKAVENFEINIISPNIEDVFMELMTR
ncbi:MAG: ABC transporter ATP-binding protein [Candidatus Kapabacteria bacterium]|nr:ABC transporter ATP-binding protein [Candidatus Kapabacteria bacterium]